VDLLVGGMHSGLLFQVQQTLLQGFCICTCIEFANLIGQQHKATKVNRSPKKDLYHSILLMQAFLHLA